MAFRVLGPGNLPGHRTICGFRRWHLEDFKGLCVEVVRVARGTGPVRFGKLSVDGTKVRANASKRKAKAYGRMLRRKRELEAEIGALPDRAHDTDAEEDRRFGESFRGDGVPEELRREDRLAEIDAAMGRLEAEQRGADDARGREPGRERDPKGGRPYKRAYGEPDGKAQRNFTDPDGAIMRTGLEGFRQCSNAQVAVDGEHRLIVATVLTSNASDQGALVGLLDEVRDGACRRRGLQRTGPVGTGGAGHRRVRGDGARGQAVGGQERGAAPGDAHRMVEKPATPTGRERYAQCKRLSEAPNGRIREVLGFRRSGVRGLAKARGEWNLVCLVPVIKRLQPLPAG